MRQALDDNDTLEVVRNGKGDWTWALRIGPIVAATGEEPTARQARERAELVYFALKEPLE